MAKVLVVGGAGYVGSTTCAWLLDSGHDVWVLDNLSTGHKELLLGRGFTYGQAGDASLVSALLVREKFDCAMHFAAKSLVGESVRFPQEYRENNVIQTQILLNTLLEGGVRNIIFSSSCAVFGNPGDVAIREDLPKNPVSPYGENKLEVERMMESLAQQKGLRGISLRYFNAAGAEPKLRVGEWHDPETHLIPKILKAATGASSSEVEIYGTQYPTPDGTCIRDYIHVWDLAEAHGKAMNRLLALPAKSGERGNLEGYFEAFNLGSEKGFSVREVISACEKVTGKKLQVLEKAPRPGDAPRLVADSRLANAKLELGRPRLGLDVILSSAWNWEKKRTQIHKIQAKSKKAVFLDRDGTINLDPGYLSDPAQMRLLPNVGEGLALLKKAGFLLVVVSNQSGVARGLIEESDLPKIHRRLEELLSPWNVKMDRYELCLHLPEEDCDCRKPKPKLLLDAARELGVDLTQSYMVGDKVSDMGAGQAAGCKGSALVRTGEGSKSEGMLQGLNVSFIGDSLLDVAKWILSQENVGS